MDRYWRPDMTVEEGLALVKRCVEEIKGRLVINLANFTLKVSFFSFTCIYVFLYIYIYR